MSHNSITRLHRRFRAVSRVAFLAAAIVTTVTPVDAQDTTAIWPALTVSSEYDAMANQSPHPAGSPQFTNQANSGEDTGNPLPTDVPMTNPMETYETYDYGSAAQPYPIQYPVLDFDALPAIGDGRSEEAFRPGLLGKRYASVHYFFGKSHTSVGNGFTIGFDGISVSLNAPLWLSSNRQFGLDVFAEGSHGDTDVFEFDVVFSTAFRQLTNSSLGVGLRVYGNGNRFRPFTAVILGRTKSRDRVAFESENYLAKNEFSSDIVQIGAEWDATSQLSIRSSIDYNTRRSLEGSIGKCEAILRPRVGSPLFFRGGISSSFKRHRTVTGRMGVGLDF